MPGGRELDYAYDANGNVSSVTPPSRPAHTFAYNLLDMATGATAPDAGEGAPVTTYEYGSADHELTKITRPSGDAATVDHDSGGRVSAVHDAQGTTGISYSAATGNVASVNAPSGENLDFTFDGALPTGQTQSGPVAGSTSVAYNIDLNVSGVTAAGAATTYGYDADGLLTSAGALSITRDPANGLLTGTSLSGTTSATTYNQFAEPATEQTSVPGGANFSETYTRDDAGRITTKQESSPSGAHTYAYLYDPAGRLTNVTKDGNQSDAYAYDANGNRTSVTRGSGASAVTTTSTSDVQDRMKTSGDFDLTYNANGELTKKKNRVSGDETTYAYSTLGDLIGAVTPSGDHIDYILDGLGRRTGKQVNGNLTQGFLYAPGIGGPVAQLDGNGNVVERFSYATHTNVPDYIERNGNTYRVITDQLGSPRMVVNADTGAVAQELEYDEFGRVLSDSNPGFQPFGFAGGIYDSDTGLAHFGAREYDAGLGRWTAVDPTSFAGGDANLYGYVVGDPVNMTDPSGLLPTHFPDPIAPIRPWIGRVVDGIGNLVQHAPGAILDFLDPFKGANPCPCNIFTGKCPDAGPETDNEGKPNINVPWPNLNPPYPPPMSPLPGKDPIDTPVEPAPIRPPFVRPPIELPWP